MNDDTSTLSRWSKLKRQAEAEKQASANRAQVVDEEIVPDVGVQLGAASDIADLPDVVSDSQPTTGLEATENAVDEEPLLTDEDMPEVSTLTSQSDISMFFNRGVSKTARNAALKYLFQLPQYNIRDGLNDYDEDYTYFEPLGDTVTCDMKFHKERKEREAREAEEEALLAEQQEAEQAEQAATEEDSEETADTTSEETSEETAENKPAEDDALEADATEDTDQIQDGDALHADSKAADPQSETAPS